MEAKKIVGRRIQCYRKRKKITQEQLAEFIGIDTVSLSKIETGKNYPTAENISKIAEYLDVELYELFIDDYIKNNDELLNEIRENIVLISKDNKKLHIVSTVIKSLLF